MNAKELRINNWVNTPAGYEQVIDVMCDSINTMHYNGITYDDIEPIPLSPEILEKCGFYQVKGKSSIYRNEDATWQIAYSERNSILYRHYHNDEYCYVMGVLYHVHQLQNLLYFLSQTELNIKL